MGSIGVNQINWLFLCFQPRTEATGLGIFWIGLCMILVSPRLFPFSSSCLGLSAWLDFYTCINCELSSAKDLKCELNPNGLLLLMPVIPHLGF